jgi:hypothetical protein
MCYFDQVIARNDSNGLTMIALRIGAGTHYHILPKLENG